MKHRGNRQAIELAAGFFKGNIALSLSAIAILIAIALFRMLPLLGILFAFAYPLLSFAVQIYIARITPSAASPEKMAEVARQTRLSDLFSRHLDIAAGGFLGFFLILMLLSTLFLAMISGSVDLEALAGNDMTTLFASISSTGAVGTLILFLLLGMWLGYLMPGVMGEVIFSDTFADAFRRTFLLFSPTFWKRTLNRDYFLLILVWSAIVFVAAVILSWIALSILLLPVSLIGAYLLSLYNAVIYAYAHETLTVQ